MEHWDSIVAERNKKEKNALRLKKMQEKNSISFDTIYSNKNNSSVTSKEKEQNLSDLLSNDLFD